MLSLAQERALAIVPKVMSSFSMPCSCFIIYEVFCDHRTRGTTPVQRALVGMSLVDISASFAWFLSTWAVPEGSFAYASGNRVSCNFQGFLLQLAIGAPLYNSSLALFYLLIIKQRWTDQELVKIERWVHGFILSFTIGTSILLLELDIYNHIGAVCWVIGEPAGCGNSSYQGSDVPCIRGDYAYLYGLALFYGPLWVCVIACCTSMVILWREVRNTHRRSRRYSTAVGMQHNLSRSGSDSSRVATQAILYSLSFVITWMPSTFWSIAHWFNWSHFGLDMAAASCEPLQGFWNMLIFLKSRPKSVLKIRRALAYFLPCICSAPSDFDPTQSFASGLRQAASRIKSSDIDPFQSSSDPNFVPGQQMADSNSQEDPKKKLAQRGTASTEELDDLKSSMRDLDCDISGYSNRNKKNIVECEDESISNEFGGETGESEINVTHPEPSVDDASDDNDENVGERRPDHVGDETDETENNLPQPSHSVDEASEDADDHAVESRPDNVEDETENNLPHPSHTGENVVESEPNAFPICDEQGAEPSEIIDEDGPAESSMSLAEKEDVGLDHNENLDDHSSAAEKGPVRFA